MVEPWSTNNPAYKNSIIAIKEVIEIITHKETPNIIGFHPADLILSTDSPAPIKNNVITKRTLELLVIVAINWVGIFV